MLEKIEGKAGDSIELKDIIFVADEDKKIVKSEALSKANVKGTIIEQAKGNKVIVFKHKAKKGYRRKRGHRQLLTKVKIDEIILGERKSKASEKPKKVAKKADTKKIAKKTVAKKTTKAAPKESTSGKREVTKKKAPEKVASKPTKKTAAKTTAKKETKKPSKSAKSSTKKSSASKAKTASKPVSKSKTAGKSKTK